MDNADVAVEVFVSRKDLRKLFGTIILANLVSYAVLKAGKRKLDESLGDVD